jgi:hypothetical protein
VPLDGGLVAADDRPRERVRAPRVAQFSTEARTSGARRSRRTPAVAATRSAAASSVTRKFDAMDAAA